MRQWIQKPTVRYCCFAVIFAGLAILGSQLLLRSLWCFLSFDSTFSDIFRQISSARMASPLLLTALLSLLCSLVFLKLWRIQKLLALPVGLLLLPLLWAATLLFTRVNSIMFYDVLRTLIPLLESGVL